MSIIRITVEYDGTDYVGWARQPNGPSVQAALEKALAIVAQAPVLALASGRTDAGVHAAGQVVSFAPPCERPLKAWHIGVNSELPRDIAVVKAEHAPDGFDARRSASGKRYRYQIWNGPTRSPLHARTAWEIFRPLNVEAMARAAREFLGEHDFAAFRAEGCDARTTVRTMRRVDVTGISGGGIAIEVEATAFLRHMVRAMVGTLVDIGHGKRANDIARVLASRDRGQAGPTAPPHGLCLMEVYYNRSVGP